jgi:hypothetical protein
MTLKCSPRVRTAIIAAAAASVVALPAVALAAGSHPDNTSAAKKAIQGGQGPQRHPAHR